MLVKLETLFLKLKLCIFLHSAFNEKESNAVAAGYFTQAAHVTQWTVQAAVQYAPYSNTVCTVQNLYILTCQNCSAVIPFFYCH